jgi:SAM-dependent methyltransferase
MTAVMEGKAKIPLVQRVDYLKEACRGKKVLHLGCTNWPYTELAMKHDVLLHLQLQDIASELWGLDADQEGIDVLATRGVKNLYKADLERLEELDVHETFDVILAGEMIEHLSNPGLFLRGIKRFMNENTNLLITTINAYCGMRMAVYGLRGKGGAAEPVHPDHVAYYSYSTLRHLIGRENLVVKKFLFYDLGPEHRPHNRWILNLINDVFVKFAPQTSDGVIVECGLV